MTLTLAVEIFRYPFGTWDLVDDDGHVLRRMDTRKLGLSLAGLADPKLEVSWQGTILYTKCTVHGQHAFARLVDGGCEQKTRAEIEQTVAEADQLLTAARRQSKAALN